MDQDEANIVSLEDFEHAKENIIPLAQGRSAKMLAAIYGDRKKGTAVASAPTSSTGGGETNLNYQHHHHHHQVGTLQDSNASYHTHPQDESEKISLERAIASTPMDADDPLEPHHRLLMWYQERFPSGHPDFPSALERAARSFRKDPRYKEDLRYIRMWLQVAKRAKTPEDVFKYLSVNSIGQGSAIFYEEYAAYMETCRRFVMIIYLYLIGYA
jgi:checkpoint serine/threonine-protein kinase